MEKQDARAIQAALAQPFAPEDLEWRLQKVVENKQLGIAVPYVTNRAIQNRLDDVVGPDRWYNDFKPWHKAGNKESQVCGISIFFEDRGWITKWDGAEDSDIEPIKGGLSDSMKRAAVQWGIGRVLYEVGSVFVDIEQRGGKTWYIAKKEQPKLDQAYLDTLKRLGIALPKAAGTQGQPGQTGQAEKPAQPKAKESNAPQKPKVLPKPGQDQPKAPTPEPTEATEVDYEYKVLNARPQHGMSSSNTQLVLESPDGKRINAFARGEHPELTPGVLLHGTRLTMKTQDTVVFYVLEEYQTISYPQAA